MCSKILSRDSCDNPFFYCVRMHPSRDRYLTSMIWLMLSLHSVRMVPFSSQIRKWSTFRQKGKQIFPWEVGWNCYIFDSLKKKVCFTIFNSSRTNIEKCYCLLSSRARYFLKLSSVFDLCFSLCLLSPFFLNLNLSLSLSSSFCLSLPLCLYLALSLSLSD